MPLLRQQEVHGVFELLSSRTHAFEERDVTALQRLGEMIHTADQPRRSGKAGPNATRHRKHPGARPVSPHEIGPSGATSGGLSCTDQGWQCAAGLSGEPTDSPGGHGGVNNCDGCGFPVSGGENFAWTGASRPPGRDHSPVWYAETRPMRVGSGRPHGPEESWSSSHNRSLEPWWWRRLRLLFGLASRSRPFLLLMERRRPRPSMHRPVIWRARTRRSIAMWTGYPAAARV